MIVYLSKSFEWLLKSVLLHQARISVQQLLHHVMLMEPLSIMITLILSDPDQTVLISSFLPTAQTLEFVFTLFPDEIAEGTEAFQARSSPSEGADDPDYTVPTELNTLFAETFIIIEDDDRELPVHASLCMRYLLALSCSIY